MSNGIKEKLGVRFDLIINVKSDEAKQVAAVTFQCGVNKIPDKKEVDKAIQQAFEAINDAFDVNDARLTTLEDYGMASPEGFNWIIAA